MCIRDRCIGCGTCTKGVCFVNAIELINEHAVISQECRGCGRCVDICPQKAIKITVEDENYVKKTIKEIGNLIDVT